MSMTDLKWMVNDDCDGLMSLFNNNGPLINTQKIISVNQSLGPFLSRKCIYGVVWLG